uniref:Uncharacterized protein n=1 Tax=Tanacetum cinerariifolium TaxID=118510 RepID=A0A6L2NKC3_TANCI|nr:hypothetical protein [Tanacetum cinerariifolium]
MVVQNSMGEGSAIPTDPQHISIILQPSTSQQEKSQKHKKSRRKVTEVPQPNDPMKHVVDEAVYKELDDRLVRAAISASSLEAEQDSVGGPGYQDTMGDTITQTGFERVSKLSNDSLLARGNTLQSDEDRLKLNELIELCITLQSRVLDLEKTKTTQALEIDRLKRMVKKLEMKQRSRTYKLKRLYKESHDIDADEDITLVNDQDDEQMFDVNDLQGKEVFVQEDVADKEVNAACKVNAVSIATTDSAAAKMTVDEVTLAQALMEIISTKPKAKGIVLQEPTKRPEEKRNRPPTRAQQKSITTELVEESSKKVKAEVMKGSSKRAGTKLEQESSKKQKIDDDKETVKLKQLVKIIPDEEGVAINAIPLAVKPPSIVDWKI